MPSPFPSSGRGVPSMSVEGAPVFVPASIAGDPGWRWKSETGLTNCGSAEMLPLRPVWLEQVPPYREPDEVLKTSLKVTTGELELNNVLQTRTAPAPPPRRMLLTKVALASKPSA